MGREHCTKSFIMITFCYLNHPLSKMTLFGTEVLLHYVIISIFYNLQGKRQGQRFVRGRFQRARKLSFLSISRFSGLSSAVTPTMGSVSSLLPSSDEMPSSSEGLQDGGEEIESTLNSSVHTPGKLSKEEDEEPLSDCKFFGTSCI